MYKYILLTLSFILIYNFIKKIKTTEICTNPNLDPNTGECLCNCDKLSDNCYNNCNNNKDCIKNCYKLKSQCYIDCLGSWCLQEDDIINNETCNCSN